MTRSGHGNSNIRRLVAVLAGAFGLVTILSAGLVLSGVGAQAAGQTVGVVLWTNLLLGPVYVLAAVLLWRGHGAARPLALVIAAVTALAGLVFLVAIARGVPFETRTVGALAFRVVFWLAAAWAAVPRAT